MTAVRSGHGTGIRAGDSTDARPLSIVHTLSSLNIGGMEQVVLRLAMAQKAAGHRVGILALRGGPLEQEAVRHDLQMCVLRSGLMMRGLLAVRYFRSVRPDVIHVHNPTSLHYAVLSRLVARPALVLTVHGETHARRGSALEWRLVKAVAVVSHAALRTLRLPCDPGKFTVIHNGIAPSNVTLEIREAARADLGVGDRVVGTIVARLNGRKGHATLLNSVSLLRDAGVSPLMLVVGDGPERGAIEQQAQQLGLDAGHVRFLGARSDVDRILSAADFFVLPSDTEGLPLSVLEAMAHGLPIVASRVGGIPEIIENVDQGLLVPPGDPAALSEAIRRVVEDPALRRNLASAARSRVNTEFSIANTLENYDRLYRAALAA
jgi:glycosyltransferase involved in cell wall biosynthesis